MATISTRIDDETKKQAENIASEIGITLSTAISIFLKQFVGTKGFPFDVVSPNHLNSPLININELDEAVKKAVANPENPVEPASFTYLDPKTKKLVRIGKD